MRHFLSLLLLAAVVMTGLIGSACIEQTPLNLPTRDVCGIPDPGDTVSGETTDDVVPADTAADTPGEDTPGEDTPGEDTPAEDTPPDLPPDVCVPDCDGKPCGADDGCGGLCQGDCDPGWVCVPGLGDCFPESCTDSPDGELEFVAEFPDDALLAKVNEKSGLNQATFTWDEVNDIIDLDANHKNTDPATISNLAGLECLLNLETLGLSGHGSGLVDLTPLADLTSLTHLDLGDNGILDISPLKELPKLVLLDLGGNMLGDVAAAELSNAAFGATLLLLDLSGNGFVALPDLAAYDVLVKLDFAWNSIGDITSLETAGFKDTLVILRGEGNKTADLMSPGIESLASLTGYFETPAGSMPTELDNYVQEEWKNTLVVSSNTLGADGALDALLGMSALRDLRAGDCEIEDQDLPDFALAPIAGTDLDNDPGLDLDLSWNKLVSPGVLGHILRLKTLNLEGNTLPNLDFIGNWQAEFPAGDWPQLEALDVSWNGMQWDDGGSPLFGLITLQSSLVEFVANGALAADEENSPLGNNWLPGGTSFIHLTELRLGDNGLTGADLVVFNQGTDLGHHWDPLLSLYLPDNQIASGLDQLYLLTSDPDPAKWLQVLDLTGNPITDCQAGVTSWDGVCANLGSKLQTFDVPNTCSSCP